ncbi:MAG: nicotinate phosphoribosyltransferase, partial [Acidimicrobiales bacterium]|nr:nicotinate phosphoribosyltransferase [Acidimicrobiales bacterium]
MESPTSALLTDHYELTMVASALSSGAANQRAVFEVFARRLPKGRAYGVVAGIDRVLDAVSRFRFDEATVRHLVDAGVVVEGEMTDWLRDYRFRGDISGYAEGELFFPYSPVLTVTGTFAECVVLETVVLSVLNHDCAVASAAARMADAAGGRLLIEGGSRRTDPESAVAAARAGFVGGFDATSNLEAGRRHGIPTGGTTAHAFVLAHTDEKAAFAAQRDTLGVGS